MASWLYHYLYLDFYIPLWPNLAASGVVYVLVAAKLRALRKVHDELRDLHASHRVELARIRGGGDVMAEVRKAREDFHTVLAALNALHGAGGAGGKDAGS